MSDVFVKSNEKYIKRLEEYDDAKASSEEKACLIEVFLTSEHINGFFTQLQNFIYSEILKTKYFAIDYNAVVNEVMFWLWESKFSEWVNKDIAFISVVDRAIQNKGYSLIAENKSLSRANLHSCLTCQGIAEKYGIPFVESEAYKIALLSEGRYNTETVINAIRNKAKIDASMPYDEGYVGKE